MIARLTALSLGLTIGVLACGVLPTDTASPTPDRCEEDMPCWDCNTMGNRLCGDPVRAWLERVDMATYAELERVSANGGVWSCGAEIHTDTADGYVIHCTNHTL